MTVAVSTSKVRICQDLFDAVSGRGINEDADTLAAPACKIGHALRDENLHGWPLSTPLRNGYGTQRYHQVGGPSVLLLLFCSRRLEYLSVMRVEMARGVSV